MPLPRWRGAMHAIPQDPLLLDGPLIRSLDPGREFAHAAVWEALRLVGLEGMVQARPLGLQTPVTAV